MNIMNSIRTNEEKIIIACVLILCFLLYVYIAKSRKTCPLSPPLGTLHFDCYVINMKHDARRMKGFMKAYSKSDVSRRNSLIRHDATVGKDVPIAEYLSSKALCEILQAERLSYRQKHYELTRGAVGCWLSHTELWRKIMETDKEYAIIFEDDCILARNFHAVLRESQVPADWDICLLGYICNSCEPVNCADAVEVKRFFGLHAYMIRRSAIKKILENRRLKEITKQIDSVLSDMVQASELRVYALPQPIAWQNNMAYATTIQMQLKRLPGVDVWE